VIPSDAELAERIAVEVATLGPERAAALFAARGLLGLEPTDPRYREIVYRYDHASRRAALAAGQSGCGLVRETILEAAGWRDPDVARGADIRGALGGLLAPITLELRRARQRGADIRGALGGLLAPITLELRRARQRGAAIEGADLATYRPIPGDGIVMGCRSCPGTWAKGSLAMEHMATVVAVDAQAGGASYVVHCCDGGQPGVHARSRAIVLGCGPRGDEVWAANLDATGAYAIDPADRRPTKGRRVLVFLDFDRELA